MKTFWRQQYKYNVPTDGSQYRNVVIEAINFRIWLIVGLPSAKVPPNLKSLHIVFLLIVLHWDIYNDIQVDVLFSPLNNLKYFKFACVVLILAIT